MGVTTQSIEVQHFQLFRCMATELPDGEVKHSDVPDFLIRTAHETIGVEHTRVFKPDDTKGPTEAALDSNKDDIVADAQQYCTSFVTPPLFVRLFFNLRESLKKAERKRVAKSIANLVHANIPEAGDTIVLRYGLNSHQDYPAEVDEILISRWCSPDKHDWRQGDAIVTIDNVETIFQSAIDEKGSKLESYLESCDRCWLLLAADLMKQAQGVRLDESCGEKVYVSPFERTYFLDCTRNTLMQLRTTTLRSRNA